MKKSTPCRTTSRMWSIEVEKLNICVISECELSLGWWEWAKSYKGGSCGRERVSLESRCATIRRRTSKPSKKNGRDGRRGVRCDAGPERRAREQRERGGVEDKSARRGEDDDLSIPIRKSASFRAPTSVSTHLDEDEQHDLEQDELLLQAIADRAVIALSVRPLRALKVHESRKRNCSVAENDTERAVDWVVVERHRGPVRGDGVQRALYCWRGRCGCCECGVGGESCGGLECGGRGDAGEGEAGEVGEEREERVEDRVRERSYGAQWERDKSDRVALIISKKTVRSELGEAGRDVRRRGCGRGRAEPRRRHRGRARSAGSCSVTISHLHQYSGEQKRT